MSLPAFAEYEECTGDNCSHVAAIGNKHYATLDAAVADAQSGDTITLLSDVNLGSDPLTIGGYAAVSPADKSITLDLGTFAISGGALDVFGTLTITGTTGSVTGTKHGIYVNEGGTLNINGGAITTAGEGYPVVAVSGNVSISGGTVRNTEGAGGVLVENGTLSITGGTVESSKEDTAAVQILGTTEATITGGTVTGHDWGITAFNTSTLTVGGSAVIGTANNEGYAICTNGNPGENATITVNGGTITGAELGIYQPSGKLTVSDGDITGATGIYFKSNSLNISGGTIIGNGTAADYEYYGNGANPTGDALVIDSCGYPNGIGDVAVSGGTFTSDHAKAVACYTYQQNTPVTNFITGGTFNKEVDGDYLAEGYKLSGPDTNGYYTVEAKGLYKSGDAWHINSLKGLEAFRDSVNGIGGDAKDYSGEIVYLDTDIDLGSETWTPIGQGYYNSKLSGNYRTGSTPFKGTFDGQNHTISNLNVSTDGIDVQPHKDGTSGNVSVGWAAGLFGMVQNGTVRNLTIKNATVSSATRFAGAVAGGVDKGTIEKCTVTGAVNISGKHFVGGITGWTSQGTITGCSVTATGTISADDPTANDGDDVGGIVGYSTGTVTNSPVNSSDLTVQGIRQVGAVVGMNNGGSVTTSESNAKVYYTISNALQLELFSKVVNGTWTRDGKNTPEPADDFDGKTVKLTADIDLANVEWTPIGYGGWNEDNGTYVGTDIRPFKGTFDGSNMTISNLTISNTAKNFAGLFGLATGNAVIKNVKLDTVHINAASCVGALLGMAPAGSTVSIENCELTNATIEGEHFVGGLIGYLTGSVTDSTVTGATVEAVDRYAIEKDADGANGDDAGGLVGYLNVSAKAESNTAKNVTVTAARQGGGLIGLAEPGTTIKANTVQNAEVVNAVTQLVNSAKKDRIAFGGLVGVLDTQGKASIEMTENTVNGIKLSFTGYADAKDNSRMGYLTGGKYNETTFSIDGLKAGSGNNTVTNGSRASDLPVPSHNVFIDGNATDVAEVGGMKYTSLQAAVNAAQNNATVKLLNNVNGYVSIPKNKTLTLDLNSYAINESSYCGVYVNQGSNLTINATNGGSVTAQEMAVLVLDGGTITINGGIFTARDNAVLGTNGSKGRGGNRITINDGTFNGGIQTAGYVACGIYAANNDTWNINGGTFNITGGAGIVARAGVVNVSNVTITTTGNTTGKVGDSRVVVPCSAIVFDEQAGYPGLTDTSKIKISGGTFTSEDAAISTVPAPTAKNRVELTGGTFNTQPDESYVATGYAAVATAEENNEWKVGVVEKQNTEIDGALDSNNVTYSGGLTVKDRDDTPLASSNAVNITVSGTTADDYNNVSVSANTSAAGAVALSQIADKDELIAVVAQAIAATGSEANMGTVDKVQLAIVSKETATSKTGTNVTEVTFEVHPEAIAYNDSAVLGSAKIANSQLKEGSSYTFRLPVTLTGAKAEDMIQVMHTKDTGEVEVTQSVAKDGVNGLYIEVETTSFSSFAIRLPSVTKDDIDLTLDLDESINLVFQLYKLPADAKTYRLSLDARGDEYDKIGAIPTMVATGTGGAYVYEFSYEVPAQYVNSPVELTVCDANGDALPIQGNYSYSASVQSYLTTAKTYYKNNDKLLALISALENYSNYAGVYFNKTPLTSNSDYSSRGTGYFSTYKFADSIATNAPSRGDVISGTEMTYYGANISLLSQTRINMYFKLPGYTPYDEVNKAAIAAHEFTVTYADNTTATVHPVLQSNGWYAYISLPGRNPGKLAEKVTISYGSWSAEYSVYTYANSILQKQTSPDTATAYLLFALSDYQQAAAAYAAHAGQ